MTAPVVVTSISSPAVRGDTLHVLGSGFGFVNGVFVQDLALDVYSVPFFVDSGYSIHLSLPWTLPDSTYTIVFSTFDGGSSTSDPLTFMLPDVTPVPPPPGSFQANPIPDYTSPNMTTIRQRLRLELGDYPEHFSARVTGDGVSTRFDLPAQVVDPAQFTVIQTSGGTPTTLVAGTDFQLDQQVGIITLAAPLPSGDELSAAGVNYQFFADDELDVFILSAALKHTHNVEDVTAYWGADGFKHYLVAQRTVDTVAPVELHPIALLGAIEALEVLGSDASFDINVSTAEGTSLAREERYQNIVSLIDRKTELYDEICSMLGVGLNRVEMFTLSRVSRTTGRLIPRYRDREYDDRSLPERLNIHIDSGLTGPDTKYADPYYGGGGVWP